MDKEGELKKIEKFLNLNESERNRLLDLTEEIFFKLLSPLILLNYAEGILLPAKDSIILTTLYISALETLQGHKQGKKFNGKFRLIYNFLKDNLDENEKIDLLRSFTFSNPYEFQKGTFVSFHLMREDFKRNSKSDYYDDEFCSTSEIECGCIKWLRNNKELIDQYLKNLAKHFYEMRGAVLHDGSGVLWFHDFEKDPSIAVFSGTLFDAYPAFSKETTFISYASGLDKDTFYKMMKSAIKRFIARF